MRPSTTESLGWWSLWLAVGAVASTFLQSAWPPLQWIPFGGALASMALAMVTHATAARGEDSQWVPVLAATAALAIVVGAAALYFSLLLSLGTSGGD